MSVQAAALVPGGYIGQSVGGFEAEFFVDFHSWILKMRPAW
jgi:hypothetical protein